MKLCAKGKIPREDLVLFKKIKKVIEAMPEISEFNVSCHMICRALADFFPLDFKDGLFGKIMPHSWLITKNNLLIDPYPVGLLYGPIIIDTRFFTTECWLTLYEESPLEIVKNPEFLEQTTKIIKIMHPIILKLE